MSDLPGTKLTGLRGPTGLTGPSHARSSRQRYKAFVEDYRHKRLDDKTEATDKSPAPDARGLPRARRREYLREYGRWLWPHRYSIAIVFAFALVITALQMIEPLFMRFIIDRVLLSSGLDQAARMVRLQLAGAAFLSVILARSLINVLKDYRQKLLNIRVMLSLRQSLYDRLLHLPLPKLWDMKTGGILSRLTGDVETTTGLLQMAIISPTISVIRLLFAMGVLLTLNWRLALLAMIVMPSTMLMSFTFSRRIRPIYRTVRKDVEEIDGRVGETFSGIRVVRAFGRVRGLVGWDRGWIEHETGTRFLDLLPDTSQKYLGLYNDTRPQDSKTATLRNMLMVRRNYDALVSGDGACAGCGEKSHDRHNSDEPKRVAVHRGTSERTSPF